MQVALFTHSECHIQIRFCRSCYCINIFWELEQYYVLLRNPLYKKWLVIIPDHFVGTHPKWGNFHFVNPAVHQHSHFYFPS